jgi:nucleoside-diphosphate-sugar epimerase
MLNTLVTGGGGFLGRAIVERLIGRGDRVRSFARGAYPELARMGVEVVRGDLQDRDAVAAACAECDLVFHTAARAGIWGSYDEYYGPNVRGTENVVAGCRTHGVRRLVFTSSPSVVFDGTDMEGVDESVPYARHFETPYPETKALAERIVLAANGEDLRTVALRPHLIWGPGDNHLVPRIIARARSLRKIGGLDKKVDCIYIDNAAEAHLLAGDRLTPGSAVCGQAYFISQDEPRPLWNIVNDILSAAGLPPVTRRIPRRVALAVGAISELAYRALRIKGEPRLTRFLVRELSTAHWFAISAARRDLGYQPRVSIEEGMRRLAAWLRDRRLGNAEDTLDELDDQVDDEEDAE